jgi:hypothetical protein
MIGEYRSMVSRWLQTTQLYKLLVCLSFCPFSFGHCVVCPSHEICLVHGLIVGDEKLCPLNVSDIVKISENETHWKYSLQVWFRVILERTKSLYNCVVCNHRLTMLRYSPIIICNSYENRSFRKLKTE